MTSIENNSSPSEIESVFKEIANWSLSDICQKSDLLILGLSSENHQIQSHSLLLILDKIRDPEINSAQKLIPSLVNLLSADSIRTADVASQAIAAFCKSLEILNAIQNLIRLPDQITLVVRFRYYALFALISKHSPSHLQFLNTAKIMKSPPPLNPSDILECLNSIEVYIEFTKIPSSLDFLIEFGILDSLKNILKTGICENSIDELILNAAISFWGFLFANHPKCLSIPQYKDEIFQLLESRIHCSGGPGNLMGPKEHVWVCIANIGSTPDGLCALANDMDSNFMQNYMLVDSAVRAATTSQAKCFLVDAFSKMFSAATATSTVSSYPSIQTTTDSSETKRRNGLVEEASLSLFLKLGEMGISREVENETVSNKNNQIDITEQNKSISNSTSKLINQQQQQQQQSQVFNILSNLANLPSTTPISFGSNTTSKQAVLSLLFSVLEYDWSPRMFLGLYKPILLNDLNSLNSGSCEGTNSQEVRVLQFGIVKRLVERFYLLSEAGNHQFNDANNNASECDDNDDDALKDWKLFLEKGLYGTVKRSVPIVATESL